MAQEEAWAGLQSYRQLGHMDAGSLCDLGGQFLTPLGLSFLICSGEKSCVHGSLGPPRSPLDTATGSLPMHSLSLGLPCSQGVTSVLSACAVSRPRWKHVGRRMESLYQRPGLGKPPGSLAGEARHWLCGRSSETGHTATPRHPLPSPEPPSTHPTHHQALGRACDPSAHSQG